MHSSRPPHLLALGGLLALAACDSGHAPTGPDMRATVQSQAAASEVIPLGDFALYLPASAVAPRAVLVALGGPNTKAIVTGEPFGAPAPPVEAALQALGQSLRDLAAEHRIAILGTSRFAATALPNSEESDQLILDALAAAGDASGHDGLEHLPLLFYGASGGGGEASGFTARHPGQVAGLFLKAPAAMATLATDAQRAVPTFVVLAELDVFVDNVALQSTFVANRVGGALWALAMEAGLPHHALSPVQRTATIAWMDAVLDRRLAGASGMVRGSVAQSGWLADHATGSVAPWGAYDGDRLAVSWLPTRETAAHWQALLGVTN